MIQYMAEPGIEPGALDLEYRLRYEARTNVGRLVYYKGLLSVILKSYNVSTVP